MAFDRLATDADHHCNCRDNGLPVVSDLPCDDPANARGSGNDEQGDGEAESLHQGRCANEMNLACHLIGDQRAGVPTAVKARKGAERDQSDCRRARGVNTAGRPRSRNQRSAARWAATVVLMATLQRGVGWDTGDNYCAVVVKVVQN
jgi:hypothetical protein